MKVSITIISTFILLSQSPSFDTKGWRGIVPLKSTRADVEALLGEGTNPCKCSYYLDDINISFVYSSGDCVSGGSGNWNVNPNTVIRFTINIKAPLKLSDLKLDESKFEKQQDIGDLYSYINREDGFSADVWQNTVTSVSYFPSTRDEYMHCPDYDGISYDSDIPRELRPRLLQRLSALATCSLQGRYEEQYDLYWPAFALKMFPAKNKKEFARWAKEIGGIFPEVLIEFKPVSVTGMNDNNYGKAYTVFGIAKTSRDGTTEESYRTTLLLLRDNEWYFVDFFRLIPR